IEFAVHMRRFDETARLDHLCARGALTREHLQTFAQHFATFQNCAAVASSDSPWGATDEVIAFARDNFETLREHLLQSEDTRLLDALALWTETRFARIEPLLAKRRRSGCVREG